MQEIGEFLKEERLKQQINLVELSRHTCVSVRMLEALEDGRYDEVGTPLLIRGFIRSYCKALGIDPEPIIEQYSEDILGFGDQDESFRRYSDWMHQPTSRKRLLLYSLIGIVVLVVGFVAANVWLPSKSGKNAPVAKAPEALVYPQRDLPADLPSSNESDDSQPAAEKTAEEAKQLAALKPEANENTADQSEGAAVTADEPVQGPAESEAKTSEEVVSEASQPDMASAHDSVSTSESAPATESATSNSDVHVLTLEALEETWLQVQKKDGEKENRLMKAGEKRQWEVKQGVGLWLGNAGGVKATWDGHPLKAFGKRGQVVRLKLTGDELPGNP